MKVVAELEPLGIKFIFTQVLKLSEETCIEPEHEVLEVLVVIVVVSIASLKVMEILSLAEINEELSAGFVETTVGLIPSKTIFLLPPKDAELSSA